MRTIALRPSAALLLLATAIVASLTSCGASLVGSNQPAASDPAKATPVITWPQPSSITNPAPLTSAQLDATANVPGTFVYSPAAGTVLLAGTQTLTTTFSPTDAAGYNSATASVAIVVNAATNLPTIAAQHLAVADSRNNRVLVYDAPIGSGASASLVLGQPDFAASASSGSAAYPNTVSPSGIAVDPEGDLFVADTTHCRVLEFQPPFTKDMNASVAFGWPGLTYSDVLGYSCSDNPGISAATVEYPTVVAVDSSGNLWVADAQLAEIFEYVAPFSTGMAASVVLGTGPCEIDRGTYNLPTARNFCYPQGIAFDPNGDLWISDWGYSRVVEFTPPFSTGMAASLEIGEPATDPFTSWRKCAPVHSAYCLTPATITFDATGDLWVTDSPDNRILEFAPPFTNGMAASLVLGQPDFMSYTLQVAAANTFFFYGSSPPYEAVQDYGGLWFDSSGNLLVADGGNNRVLVFVPPFSNNMNASIVIGQSSMAGGGPACATPAANTLCVPSGVLTY